MTLTETKPDVVDTETIQRLMDGAYALGIEHAIETVRHLLADLPGLANPIVNKLKEMKK